MPEQAPLSQQEALTYFEVMNMAHPIEPIPRQVLVNIGNRYAVFGKAAAPPQRALFDPDRDSVTLPPVEDESEVARERIIQSLRVSDMRRDLAHGAETEGDIILLDKDENSTIVDVEVKSSELKKRDLDYALGLLRSEHPEGYGFEVWFFNIERLKLTTLGLSENELRMNELYPIDVWEKTETGIFHRDQVVEELNDWVRHVNGLYDTVEEWLRERVELRFDRTRLVTIYEELMQKFGVPDRDIPILDILNGDDTLASFIPRGLWLIGAWGRVDVITNRSTATILGIRDTRPDKNTLHWRLTKPRDRRQLEPLTKDALLSLVNAR